MPDLNRPDPDALLASLKQEEARLNKGRLRVFMGMCAGVGKTYAMLARARALKMDGVDVLVGLVLELAAAVSPIATEVMSHRR